MKPDCPPEDTLRRYLIGDYTDEQGSEIEQHLSQCPACEDTLAGFDDTKDILLRHLPLAAAAANQTDRDQGDEQPGRPLWLDQLKAAVPTAAHSSRRSGEDPTEILNPSDGNPNSLSGLDSYELLGVLGRGGMGVVYRARHRQLDRPVAIKVVHPKLTSALHVRDRFEKEIRILGGMNHPGIVMATDAGRVGPAAYLVMELIDGIDLARLVREQGPLSIGQATAIAKQVAEALAAAHASNAIHRDVKPSNVMLDRNGRAKLLDFGLAHLTERANEHDQTSLGHVLGTLDYMAPEQANGESVTSQTDLYGLGALLFYLLTGQPPHGDRKDRTLLQQLKSITSDEVRDLSELRVDAPEGLRRLVSRLLSRDLESRPDGAGQVAELLAEFADAGSLKSLTETLPTSSDTANPAEVDQSLFDMFGAHKPDLSLGSANEATSPHARGMVTNAPVAKPQAKDSRSFSLRYLFLFVGLSALTISLALMLTLKTRYGTIQITSEIPGIQVELVDEKDHAEKLTIKNKDEETELKLGKYRVRILGNHDGMELDRDTVVLTEGKREVVTIRRMAAESVANNAATSTPKPQGSDNPATAEHQPEKRTRAFFDSILGLPASDEVITWRQDSKLRPGLSFYVVNSETWKFLLDSEDYVGLGRSRKVVGRDATASINIKLTDTAQDRFNKAVARYGGNLHAMFNGDDIWLRPISELDDAEITIDPTLNDKDFDALILSLLKYNVSTLGPLDDDQIQFFIANPETNALIGDAILTGSDIETLGGATHNNGKETAIEFTVTDEAAARLGKATRDNIGKNLAILSKGRLLSAARINSQIGKRGQIQGVFTKEEVEDLLGSIQQESTTNGGANVEPTYEGKPRSYWESRLKTEKGAAALCKVAEGLQTLVTGSPTEQIQARVGILAQVYGEAFGKNMAELALYEIAGGDKPSSKWASTSGLNRLKKSVIQQIEQLPERDIVIELCNIIAEGKSPQSETALVVLTDLQFTTFGYGDVSMTESERKEYDSEVVDLLLPTRKPGRTLSMFDQARVLFAARTYRREDSPERRRCEKAMNDVGEDLAKQLQSAFKGDGSAPGLLRASRAWFDSQKKWKSIGIGYSSNEKQRISGIDLKLSNQVALGIVLNDSSAGDKFFKAGWARAEYPYGAKSLKTDRDWAYPVWEQWPDVATEQLAAWEPGEHRRETDALLKSLIVVLPTRTENDKWDVKATAAVLERELRWRYAGSGGGDESKAGEQGRLKSDVSNHDLLTALIQCGAEIPDFVIEKPPADASLAKRLDEFAELITGSVTYDEYKQQVAGAKGLIQDAPFHTVSAIFRENDLPVNESGSRLSLHSLIRDASNVKDVYYAVTGTSSDKSRLDPLLMMAVLAELSKTDAASIDFEKLRKKNHFERPIRDTLRCSTEVGKIAQKFVQRIDEAERASSKAKPSR